METGVKELPESSQAVALRTCNTAAPNTGDTGGMEGDGHGSYMLHACCSFIMHDCDSILLNCCMLVIAPCCMLVIARLSD